MLDFSFGEILVIAIIAIIFLGPDKLPQTFVDIAKFFKAFKKTINEAKDTLDREIHLSEMKQDALEYKKKFEENALNLQNDILKDSNIEKSINEVKTELQALKATATLNEDSAIAESLENKTISFDSLETKAKELEKKIHKNLKPKTTKAKTNTKSKSKELEAKKATESATTKNTKTTKPKQETTKKTTNKKDK